DVGTQENDEEKASRKAEEASSRKDGCCKEAISTQKEREQKHGAEERGQKEAWDAPAQALEPSGNDGHASVFKASPDAQHCFKSDFYNKIGHKRTSATMLV
ncbi:MAG TPA: hypothetical protein VKB96_04480, partial [Gammaproteobacteria bacterium]|nr:hypothetical protein [Gammaproteobacteria bacterium]